MRLCIAASVPALPVLFIDVVCRVVMAVVAAVSPGHMRTGILDMQAGPRSFPRASARDARNVEYILIKLAG